MQLLVLLLPPLLSLPLSFFTCFLLFRVLC